jgi:hypothetical protein
MIECKVDAIRGKNIQRMITIRNRFEWTVRSVQTFSRNGYKNDYTMTQVVYERQHDYPHRSELEALEVDADKLVFPNPKPAVRKMVAMIILAVIFGLLYLATPYVRDLLAGGFPAIVGIADIAAYIFLGLAALFFIPVLPLMIVAIVKKVKLKKNLKKMEVIISAATKIQLTPVAVVHPVHAAVVGQPIAPAIPVSPTPSAPLPKTEKPLIRPFVKAAVAQPTPSPEHPAEPSPVKPAEPVVEKPVE